MISHVLAPAMEAVGFPPPLLPMVLMRPLSGSGTLGLFAELVKQYGPDSLISRMGGTIFGSTETTFYVLAVYFGSVNIKKTRYALTGSHMRVKCDACHTQKAPAGKPIAEIGQRCLDCHGKDDVHEGQFGPRCEQCHTPTRWLQIDKRFSNP